jgi:hypothetical protein
MIQVLTPAARDWLHYWQDLVGAGVGAVALLLTVAWTLARDRRRNRREAAAFRAALGGEIRQFAASTLNNCHWLAERVAKVASDGESAAVYATQLLHVTRLPEAIVFSRGADKLGILGQHLAFDTVYFYGQLDLLRQSVQQIHAVAKPTQDLSVKQIMGVMAAMLTAVRAAIKALPAFKGRDWTG